MTTTDQMPMVVDGSTTTGYDHEITKQRRDTFTSATTSVNDQQYQHTIYNDSEQMEYKDNDADVLELTVTTTKNIEKSEHVRIDVDNESHATEDTEDYLMVRGMGITP